DRVEPGAQGIHPRDVDQNVGLATKLVYSSSPGAMPVITMSDIVGPDVGHDEPIEGRCGGVETVGRVGAHFARGGVVATGVVVAILQEPDFVPQPLESQDVLQMVPGHATDGATNEISQQHNPQPACARAARL